MIESLLLVMFFVWRNKYLKARQEYVWFQRLFDDLHLPLYKSSTIFGDNESTLKLAVNLVYHARTKHIKLERHFVRQL